MDNQNKELNGANGGNGGTTGKKSKRGFVGAVKSGLKSAWIWLTTSKAGKVTLGVGTTAVVGLAAKTGFDKGFAKGVASVPPTTVYITSGTDDSDEDDQEPEEDQDEVAEETTAE